MTEEARRRSSTPSATSTRFDGQVPLVRRVARGRETVVHRTSAGCKTGDGVRPTVNCLPEASERFGLDAERASECYRANLEFVEAGATSSSGSTRTPSRWASPTGAWSCWTGASGCWSGASGPSWPRGSCGRYTTERFQGPAEWRRWLEAEPATRSSSRTWAVTSSGWPRSRRRQRRPSDSRYTPTAGSGPERDPAVHRACLVSTDGHGKKPPPWPLLPGTW